MNSGNIYLIGMMGSGKSTVGKLLAEKMQMTFIDLDEIIEASAQKTVRVIFEQDGELHFRKLESEALVNVNQENSVISCGGGIILDESNEPRMVLNSDSLLRDALFKSSSFDPYLYCHRPIIIKSPQVKIREVLPQFKVHPVRSDDDVIDEDIILFWGKEKKVITGSDILGRLLRGIVQ